MNDEQRLRKLKSVIVIKNNIKDLLEEELDVLVKEHNKLHSKMVNEKYKPVIEKERRIRNARLKHNNK